MYTTTGNIAGGTFMTCKDCGDAISMNKLCENPLQSATDMLKHMAAHNAAHAFPAVSPVIRPEVEAIPLEVVPFVKLPLNPIRLRPNPPILVLN